MIVVKGTYNSAKVFTNDLEDTAAKQIKELLEQEFVEGLKIRIMPDVHAGAGCTIGTTMTLEDKVVPNLVGVDIGCGVEVVRLGKQKPDYRSLDELIYRGIPSGFKIRKREHPFLKNVAIDRLICKNKAKLNMDRAKKSLGTLGGGNHFIEIGENEKGEFYLLIHSGSRNIGLQVALYYQKLAQKKQKGKGIPRDLTYLEGKDTENYLHDMALMQNYAEWNRRAMAQIILDGLGYENLGRFSTIHNYIDIEEAILRKGAVSAKKGEIFLLPMNMRDGSFICRGKGNPDWNYSAPHGAGRILSRTQARKKLSLKEFKTSMEGIYTTSAQNRTLDEAPRAYKKMHEILENVEPTLEVLHHLKVRYNYKATN